MNTLEIEDRIRAATRAAADTVTPDSVPQLRLPSERPFRSSFRSWFRSSSGPRRPRAVAVVWAQRLAPIAAAVAVIAVAVTLRCDGCIAVHTDAALRQGATEEEIAEALGVAVAINAGAALVYSTRVLDAVRSA